MTKELQSHFLVVKDDEGIIRPMAGIWRDNEAGRDDADRYAAKHSDVTIVRVLMEEA